MCLITSTIYVNKANNLSTNQSISESYVGWKKTVNNKQMKKKKTRFLSICLSNYYKRSFFTFDFFANQWESIRTLFEFTEQY